MKSDKPLKKFLQKQGVTDEKRRQLVARLYIQIMDGMNLFLVTNPLANGNEESAIETLFSEEVLLHEIELHPYYVAESVFMRYRCRCKSCIGG